MSWTSLVDLKENLSFFYLDQTFPSTIKDEKQERYVKSDSTTTDTLDQPLLIVLDEDDGNYSDETPTLNIDSTKKNELSKTSATGWLRI